MAAVDLRLTFDEDAELYDRARPGYPTVLFDDVAELAGLRSGSQVLEVGAGTGQATLPMASRGWSVLAVELGASLAAVLRRKAAELPVETVVGQFEDIGLPVARFEAVAAFTAWHWLTPDLRVARVCSALRPGGALVTVTTTHVRGGSEQFFDDVQACYERWDPTTPPGLRTEPPDAIPPDTDEVDLSPLFEPAVRRRYTQDVTYSTDGYLDVLSTYSGHRGLAPDRRAGLLRAVRDLIAADYQGSVTKRYLYELRVARRRHGSRS